MWTANGYVDYYDYSNGFISARPLVRVPSDILEKKKEVVLPHVGDIVHYSPRGSYNWNAEYASSDQTGTTALSSADGGNFRVTEWKVLNVDEDTGKIDIVPTAPTTGTVRLQGAQGYNNAVYLLNDACSNLYSDSSKDTQ